MLYLLGTYISSFEWHLSKLRCNIFYGLRRVMRVVLWLCVVVTLIWVVYIDGRLQDLKLLSQLLYMCLVVNVWVYLCFPIKSSFAIDLFRVDMSLIMLQKKKGKDGGSSISVRLWHIKGEGENKLKLLERELFLSGSFWIHIHLLSSCTREQDTQGVRGRG